ncbi:MAG: tRNA uridine(34) 5-carboxymethylaminomethyl modification radical SAM/GNAT enzyme Elp3 [Candidatus Micrarchaeia archaeon]|jgi:elongator complex protein 3
MTYDYDAIDAKKFFKNGRIVLLPEEDIYKRKAAIGLLCDEISQTLPTKAEFEKAKNAYAKKFKLANVIKNAEVFSELEERNTSIDGLLANLLKVKDVRGRSGITNIAIMTRPLDSCPFCCIYCPQGIDAPKSYTGFEPSARRAKQNGFDAFKMTSARLEQLRISGHAATKCELIIQGGTFNRQPKKYRENFLRGALCAFNEKKSSTLATALKANEHAPHRMIGLTIETRPDCASKKEIIDLLGIGTTRIELGVQALSDEVYKKARRGHTVNDVAIATKNCKDALLKVCYHMMPGLFSTPKEDEKYFRMLFADARFAPDMLKIYPTLVMPGTGLYDLWKKGEYEPYDEKTARKLLARIKERVPKYARIMRIERDIPSNLISHGIMALNIRQLVREDMQAHGKKCACIRCREVGFKIKHEKIKPDYSAVGLERIDYDASGGKEIFLSMVDRTNDALMGICRVRKPSDESYVNEVGNNCGVRELHVYGEELPISERKIHATQHKGYGKALLAEAERIAKEEFDSEKLLVISGVGAKEYYYKQGYKTDGTFVSKKL